MTQPDDDRSERLSKALRANLAKRKRQTRNRGDRAAPRRGDETAPHETGETDETAKTREGGDA